MSKRYLDLAISIIKRHSNVTEQKDQLPPPILNDNGELIPSNKKVYSAMIPILGMGFGSISDDEKTAIKDMAEQLAGELESGALELSDTWVEDNLG